jgi:hypothetical protein
MSQKLTINRRSSDLFTIGASMSIFLSLFAHAVYKFAVLQKRPLKEQTKSGGIQDREI